MRQDTIQCVSVYQESFTVIPLIVNICVCPCSFEAHGDISAHCLLFRGRRIFLSFQMILMMSYYCDDAV